MAQVNLNPGDIFSVVINDNAQFGNTHFGNGIKFVTKMQSIWGIENYYHSGIITDTAGSTFEALETYKHGHLDNYKGCPIIIGRHRDMDSMCFTRALGVIKSQFEGRSYPYERMPLMMIPMMAALVNYGKPVCSELTFLFLNLANLHRDDSSYINYYWGVSPEMVARSIEMWDTFDLIYKETW